MNKVKVYEFQNQEERDEGILKKSTHLGTAKSKEELTAIINSKNDDSFLGYFTDSNTPLKNKLVAQGHLIYVGRGI